MKFFHKIRFYWFVLKNRSLIKLIKYSGDIRAHALLIVSTRIRIHFKLPFPGKNNAVERKLFKIVNSFFNNSKQVPDSDSEIDWEEILTWLENDQQAEEARKTYLRVSYWYESLMLETMKMGKMKTDEKNKASAVSSTYQSVYGERLEIPNSDDFANIRSEFRKKFKAEKNVFRESGAKLIDFSLEKLTLFLPWISLLFIFAGYIHTRCIYGYFGIEVDQFFSLNDYLSSSIEEITSALLNMTGIFLTIIYLYRNEWAWELYKRTAIRWYELLSMSFLGFCFAYLYKENVPLESLYGSIIAAVISCSVVTSSSRVIFYVVSRYFKNSTKISVILLVLIGFFSGIAFSIYSEIKNIKDGRPDLEFEIKAGTGKFTQEDFTFIGGNSRYIFLLAEGGSIGIIPIESAERVRISAVSKSFQTKHKGGQSITDSDGKVEPRIVE